MMGSSARWGELAGSAKTPIRVLRDIASEKPKPQKPVISEEKNVPDTFSPSQTLGSRYCVQGYTSERWSDSIHGTKPPTAARNCLPIRHQLQQKKFPDTFFSPH
jgi:hypothetical protein